MRRRTGLTTALTTAAVTALVTAMAGPAGASSTSTGGFESYELGNIDGQDGWVQSNPSFDVAIVDPHTFTVGDMGSRALRMSNAYTTGSFGDQTFSKQLADEAGEASAEGDGISGPRQRVFTAKFSVRTTTTAEQPGLATSISPDRGDGARMSYLRLEDRSDGVHVYFDDYSRTAIDEETGIPGAFVEKDIATLTRTAKHTLALSMVFLDGSSNDVVRVLVDGNVVHSGTSWEDYFRDVEGESPRTVDSLLFREAGSAATATAGQGFLIDDVELTSSGTDDCSFTTLGTTKTLDADCTTDHTITVGDGYTLDGNGHTITAVDPAGGHWTGAVVQQVGGTANVQDLSITAAVATACDGGTAALAGIRFDGASGEITHNKIIGLQQGPFGDGCQEGNAIDVVNTAGGTAPWVDVSGNTVTDYQKTGIRVSGPVLSRVTENTVTGYGPVDFIAQNGIQVSFDASALVDGNTIRDNYYTPKTYTACGVLVYHADGVNKVDKDNQFSDNEVDVCMNGRGGQAPEES